MTTTNSNGVVNLYHGDNISVLKSFEDNSIDSVVTDPPYGLSQHTEEDITNALSAWIKGEEYTIKKKGFMGKTWDSFVPGPELWKEVYRVLKPGGHVLCFAGSRTDDLMGISLRLAGFEIRDKVMWIYGSGFPKSHDVSKSIDKHFGAEREVVGTRIKNTAVGGNDIMRENGKKTGAANFGVGSNDARIVYENVELPVTAPATDDAKQWDGWGTALKPAFEPVIVARKPLEGTVAANVLKHGTGAINVDACRVPAAAGEHTSENKPDYVPNNGNNVYGTGMGGGDWVLSPKGRWPANVIHDGSDEVTSLFPYSKDGVAVQRNHDGEVHNEIYGARRKVATADSGYGGEGTAARFFYCAKASKADRAGSKHPTVKPISLMRYLVRLVTPPGGTILDPFAGSGTTGQAAVDEGFNVTLIEREAEYVGDISRRLNVTPATVSGQEPHVTPATVSDQEPHVTPETVSGQELLEAT